MGSVDGGREGDSVEVVVSALGVRPMGGELIVLVPLGFVDVRGVVVGNILEAMRQKSSKLSNAPLGISTQHS